MSEVKGQILGIVLVISLFGLVAFALTQAFTAYTAKIDQAVTEYAPSGD